MVTSGQPNMDDPNVSYIKEVYPTDLFVLWLLGNQCTYSCSYCPEFFNSGSIKYQPTDVIQKVLCELPPANVTFSGGEATFHPDFEKIVLEKPDSIKISVISNGSRPIGFWERIGNELKSITLTFHAEFAKLDRFAEVCNLLYHEYKKPGIINLTMIPKKWEECVDAVYRLRDMGFRVIPKPLVENFGFSATKVNSNYTPDQLSWISNSNKNSGFQNIAVYNNEHIMLYKTNPSELLSNKQTNFYGWRCYTNTQSLYINPDGSVFDTACKQRTYKGSIYTGYSLSNEPIVCSQNFCWCHSDIVRKKEKL